MGEEFIFPIKRKNLEDLYEMAIHCYKCLYGHYVYFPDTRSEKFGVVCPAGEYHKFEAYFCDGKMEIARALLEGRLEWSERLADIIFKDPLCEACDTLCEVTNKLRPMFLQEHLRKEYVDRFGPLPAHKRFADYIEKTHNAYGGEHEDRFDWLPEGIKPPKKADVIYYVGCTSSYRQKEIAKAQVKVLHKLGINFGLLYEDEWCCGSPLFRTGQIDKAKKTMEHNIDALKKAGAKTLISECPGCARAFAESWKYGLEVPVNVVHITEFVVDRVKRLSKERKLNKVEVKVTYHDPCHLGRGLNVYEPGRDILKAIPGVELIEMPRNRKNSWCCGSGGGVKAAYPDFALWSANERLNEVEFVGAKNVATPCPFCIRNLRDASREYGRGIEVSDVMEILLKAL